MAIINFPASPLTGDIYTFEDRSWIWNGRAWQSKSIFVGYTGSRGTDGYTGSASTAPGYTGSAGAGYTGSRGYSGSLGFTGSAGQDGDGYTGSQGDLGYTGSAGSAGIDGKSVSIIGSVPTENDLPDPYTGNIGDGYIVQDTGFLWTWDGVIWVEIGQLVGYTGSKGDTGDRGEVGYTGSAGIDGIDGIDGYTGSQGESSFTWGETPPSSPAVGDRWYDTTRAKLVVWINDGDSSQWVDTSASGFLGRTGYTGSVGTTTGTDSTFVISNTETSISTTTGALVVAGGVGIGGDINLGGSLYQNGVLFGGGGGGADSYVKTYLWEGALQENVSTKRYYIHVASTLESVSINLGSAGQTQSTIQIKKNGVALNTIVIAANTTYQVETVSHALAINDFLTVDITQSSSAANLYVTFVYRE